MRLDYTITDANQGTITTSGFGEGEIPAGRTHTQKNVSLGVDETYAKGAITIDIKSASGTSLYRWVRPAVG